MNKSFPTKFSSPDQSPGFLLWHLSNLWQRAQRDALSALKLTHVQFVLLAVTTWLDAQGVEITQAKLAEQAKTDPMMTSQVIRALESRQLVVRKKHPRDTRALVLNVTDEGKKLVQQAIPIVEQVDHDFFSKLQDEETHLFSEMLRDLVSK
jgi:MarR family transcriptional regulator, organic hydroperoxide resistance regulator